MYVFDSHCVSRKAVTITLSALPWSMERPVVLQLIISIYLRLQEAKYIFA